MPTCWFCEKVKGKRVCPARGGELICSKCCGTKRRVEIDCPEDCPYLHGADPNWQSAARQKEDAQFLSRFVHLNEEQIMFLLFAHHLLLSAQPRFAALPDEELREVIATAAKTLETTAKGILYSHKTTSLHLDALAEWLVGVLSARDEITTAPPASDSDVRHVLQAIRDAVADHARSATQQIRYLETAQRVLQSSLREAPPTELPESMSDEPPSDLIVPP